MSSPFAKATAGAGDFFKPAEHTNDLAIVIEAKRIMRDQPHTDFTTKQPTTRDVAIADLAFFRNSQDVNTQTPSLVLKDANITNQILVSDIERNGWLGVPAITVIRKPKQAYVYRNEVAPEAEAAAAAWYEAREKALEDVPDFE